MNIDNHIQKDNKQSMLFNYQNNLEFQYNVVIFNKKKVRDFSNEFIYSMILDRSGIIIYSIDQRHKNQNQAIETDQIDGI